MGKKKISPNNIAANKKARFEFFIEQTFEAGISLTGWEVKSLRAGKCQLVDSYVIVKNNEAWLLGAIISPLISASTHVDPDPQRTRKLLLHRKELDKLIGAIQRQGYTLLALSFYWKNNKVKVELGLGKGKKLHDKRESLKEKELQRRELKNLKLK